MITIDMDNAKLVSQWIKDGRGVARWRSHDMSDPSDQVFTPAKKKDASEFLKLGIQKTEDQPGWKYPEIHEIETDPKKIMLRQYEEVDRIHVAVKRGSGLSFVLTSASSRRLGKKLDDIPDSAYRFDYENQDAIILAPLKTITLEEWMRKNET